MILPQFLPILCIVTIISTFWATGKPTIRNLLKASAISVVTLVSCQVFSGERNPVVFLVDVVICFPILMFEFLVFRKHIKAAR